jgi:omega-amidase
MARAIARAAILTDSFHVLRQSLKVTEMKIAAAQIDCVVGDIAANTQKMREFAARAKQTGAELVVFPETADTGYSMRVIRESATTLESGAVPALRKLARELPIAIISGVAEREGSAIYNTQVFIDSSGKIAGKYRKAHLFGPAPNAERGCFASGDSLASFSLGQLRLGLSICYDLRFPEVYRALAFDHGANVFIVSSAWPFPRVEHLRTLALARAIENQSYVVLSNRVGTDDRLMTCGNSAIIDPYGVVIAGASADREELLCAEVSEDVIRSVRERMPVFADRRPELYAPSR